MLRSLFDNTKPIQPGWEFKDREFSIIWQTACLTANCYRNERGKAPIWKPVLLVTLDIGLMKSVLAGWLLCLQKPHPIRKRLDICPRIILKLIYLLLTKVNFPFIKGILISFDSSMNFLNFLMPRVDLTSGNHPATDLVVLKSPPKHQASVQYPITEISSGQMYFLPL